MNNKLQIFQIFYNYNVYSKTEYTLLTQKITLKPKTRYLITTLTSDRSCLYLVIAFMVKRVCYEDIMLSRSNEKTRSLSGS